MLALVRVAVWTNLLLVGIEMKMMHYAPSAWAAWSKELSFASLRVVGDLARDRTGLPFHLRREN